MARSLAFPDTVPHLLIKPALALREIHLMRCRSFAQSREEMKEVQTRVRREHCRLLQHDRLHADGRPQFGWFQVLLDAVKSLRHSRITSNGVPLMEIVFPTMCGLEERDCCQK